MLIIKTKEELKKAKSNKERHFKVTGELAENLYKARKIGKLSKKSLYVLLAIVGAGVVASPFTGGTSVPASAVGVAAFTGGVTTAAGGTAITTGVLYAAIAAGGLILVFALYNGYNVKVTRNEKGGVEMEFNKK